MFDEYERIQTQIQRIPDPSGYTSGTKRVSFHLQKEKSRTNRNHRCDNYSLATVSSSWP